MENKEIHHRDKNIEFSQRLCAFFCGAVALFCMFCSIYRLVYAINCRETVVSLDINSLSAEHAAQYMRLIDGAKYSAAITLLIAALGCVVTSLGYFGKSGILPIPQKFCDYSLSVFYAMLTAACFVETRGRAQVIVCALCLLVCAVLLLPVDFSLDGKIDFGLGSSVDLSENSRFRLLVSAGATTIPAVLAGLFSFGSSGGTLMFFAVMSCFVCACGCAWCKVYKEIEI